MAPPPDAPALHVRTQAGQILLTLEGDWTTRARLPSMEPLEQAATAQPQPHPQPLTLSFDTTRLERWNSTLVVFLVRCRDWCQPHQIRFNTDSLPAGVRRLIELADAVPAKTDAGISETKLPWLARIGTSGQQGWQGARELLGFLGDCVLSLGRLLRGRAQFRWSDTYQLMQECGPHALGIVALINFLVGMILAFVGAVQLTQFGASIYVADLVAIAAVREMAGIMTGIILCGRTGAAFAAQLGTMQVNEEIAALRSFVISPIDFLVLPRLIALIAMMPLLCVFANVIAIGGGFLVACSLLDVTATQYLDRTLEAITLNSYLLGVFKGSVFGFLVAFTGCLRGIQCGSNAAAVGLATTSAVVTGITAIIAADGLFAVLCNALGI